MYPRAIRLTYGPATTNGRIVASTNGVIFQSLDQGVKFQFVSKVGAKAGSKEFCCATLFELPKAVGTLAAGTLLSAAPYTTNGQFAMQVYSSADAGKTWNYLSTVATAGVYVAGGTANKGMYEPTFDVTADGALVMLYADETDPCCSQKVSQSRTYDGLKWQDQTNAIATGAFADRPGIPAISKLPDGKYFLSFELCGPASCTIFQKLSPDGWDWTPASSVGAPVLSASRQHFEHAAFNVWTPQAGSANGELLLVGQVLHDAGTGVPDAKNGQVVFTNTSLDASGPWTSTLLAPVPVTAPYDNYCPNYTSALLPSVDGTAMLELASYYNAAGACLTYAGIGPLK